MGATPRAISPLARTLRAARKGRGLSIAQLAAMAEVSPRLVSELERGMREHVSFETAMRLLHLVDVGVAFEPRPGRPDDAARARAEYRKGSWAGEKSTLLTQIPPPPPSDPVERLSAVARASRLATGLQAASRTASLARAVVPRKT